MSEPSEPSEFDKRMIAYVVERQFDLAYLKLTVIIVLLIIIIFYITCKFNVEKKSESFSKKIEPYTPFPGILINDIYRSDPAFDPASGDALR